MPIDIEQLKTEIQTDPDRLGYAEPLQIGDLASVLSLLNTVSADSPVPYQSKKAADLAFDFFTEIMEIECIPTDTEQGLRLYRFWNRWSTWLFSFPDRDIPLTVPGFSDAIQALRQVPTLLPGAQVPVMVLRDRTIDVGGGHTITLTVEQQLGRVLTRDGSRAEALFGAETVVALEDLWEALK